MTKRILGYSDEISVTPGGRIRFMVSCDPGIERYRAEIVRMRSGDVQPGGPGLKECALEPPAVSEHRGREQAIHPGSFARVPDSPAFPALTGFTLHALVMPTIAGQGVQALLTKWSLANEAGFGLFLDADGSPLLMLGDGKGGVARLSTGVPLATWEWSAVTATYDGRSGEMRIEQEHLAERGLQPAVRVAEDTTRVAPCADNGAPVMIAAASRSKDPGRVVGDRHFTGRIERPWIASEVIGRPDSIRLRRGPIPPGLGSRLVALWDFSREISSDRIVDVSGREHHGELVNLPMRAVRGAHWTGEFMDWRQAPEQYAAIHFFADALGDCAWEADFEWSVPEGLASGFYAAKLTGSGHEDYVPFFVRAPTRRPGARLALLVPTASYMAYANWRMPFDHALVEVLYNQVAVLGEEDQYVLEHPELGLSLYECHLDGSGVSYSSRHRPNLNMRPKHPWLESYSADLYLRDWLEEKGFDYDVLTDEDLHAEGVELLAPYRAVMTGTHPEYYSTRMWDALFAYQQRGGRMIYMGGNGFYWLVAYHPTRPGIIEMRRGEYSERKWVTSPGEYHLAWSGEYGGLMHNSGRTPHRLVGVGFDAQGFDHGAGYRRQAGSRDPRAAFVFAGIDDEVIGDFGLSGNGAASEEIDRFDHGFGTPRHALLLASSFGHSSVFGPSNLGIGETPPLEGEGIDPEIRADIVFYETPNGGAVFSVGSMGFAASLSHNDYDNNVSRMIKNVVTRFLDEAPFPAPSPDP